MLLIIVYSQFLNSNRYLKKTSSSFNLTHSINIYYMYTQKQTPDVLKTCRIQTYIYSIAKKLYLYITLKLKKNRQD